MNKHFLLDKWKKIVFILLCFSLKHEISCCPKPLVLSLLKLLCFLRLCIFLFLVPYSYSRKEKKIVLVSDGSSCRCVLSFPPLYFLGSGPVLKHKVLLVQNIFLYVMGYTTIFPRNYHVKRSLTA